MRTRAGYAGGARPNPTYRRMGDHTEVLQLDFDPTRISYAELLDVFWLRHSPGRTRASTQYRSVILVSNAAQRAAAVASLAEQGEVSTTVEDLGTFTQAEDDHQKFTLRRWADLLAELQAVYPRWQQVVDSTAAARINGYLAGKGSREQWQREQHLLGLSPAALATVAAQVAPSR